MAEAALCALWSISACGLVQGSLPAHHNRCCLSRHVTLQQALALGRAAAAEALHDGQCLKRCFLRRPAQFAEETKRADRNVPYGMITAVIWEAALGLAFTLAFLFCLPVRA